MRDPTNRAANAPRRTGPKPYPRSGDAAPRSAAGAVNGNHSRGAQGLTTLTFPMAAPRVTVAAECPGQKAQPEAIQVSRAGGHAAGFRLPALP
jgi:hypothetical protein